jgi:hypothetical protein
VAKRRDELDCKRKQRQPSPQARTRPEPMHRRNADAPFIAPRVIVRDIVSSRQSGPRNSFELLPGVLSQLAKPPRPGQATFARIRPSVPSVDSASHPSDAEIQAKNPATG